MDPQLIIRAVAVMLLAGSAFACAVEVGRLGGDPDPSATSTSNNADPLASELARCNALGNEATNDAACQAAWTKNRQHFFATGTTQQAHRPGLFPALPNVPSPNAPPKTELDRAPSAAPPIAGDAPAATPQGR
jgi:conjugative transfer region protein TrbK